MIPAYNVPYDWQNGAAQMARAYYQLGMTAEAEAIMKALADKAVEYLNFYIRLDEGRFYISTHEFEYHWAVLDAEVKMLKENNSPMAGEYEEKLNEMYDLYLQRLK